MAVSLLDALLRNESGGRNVPNVNQGTSSGQAQGYFQITEGTWKDFGGDKFAPNPLKASYAQQAEIASKIPLKRWDKSTIAAMQATGKKIDPDLTLGENLVANGENIATTPDMVTAGGAARHPQNPQVGKGGYVAPGTPAAAATAAVAADTPPTALVPDNAGDYALSQMLEQNNPFSKLATTLSSSVRGGGSGAESGLVDQANTPITPAPEFAKATPEPAMLAPVGLPTDTPEAAAESGLGQLFKLADNIGQAAALNTDAAGMPIRRRTYG
jgi:hypothetical protein